MFFLFGAQGHKCYSIGMGVNIGFTQMTIYKLIFNSLPQQVLKNLFMLQVWIITAWIPKEARRNQL